MNQDVKISVLIPTYNYAKYLPSAINSVLSQTYKNFELIIIDNCSEDNTVSIIESYKKKDSRIIFFKNDTNIGMTENWNKCLSLSSGKYIKFLNADDVLEKNILKEYVTVLEMDSKVALVTCWKIFIGDRKGIYKQPCIGKMSGNDVIKSTLNTTNWIGEPSLVMFRRENLWNGTFNTSLRWLPDWDMWLRQLQIGDIYIVPQVLCHIRIHSNQETKNLSSISHTVFEEYYYYSHYLEETKTFSIDNGNYLVKQKAIKLLFRIPKFIRNKQYSLMRKAIKIGFYEMVILSFLILVVKRLFKIL